MHLRVSGAFSPLLAYVHGVDSKFNAVQTVVDFPHRDDLVDRGGGARGGHGELFIFRANVLGAERMDWNVDD